MDVLETNRYTSNHLWLRFSPEGTDIGITPWGQGQIGEILYAETVPAGGKLVEGKPLGEVESMKSVVEILSPLDGEVLAVNPRLEAEPGEINTDPFETWLLRVRTEASPADFLSPGQYREWLSGSA